MTGLPLDLQKLPPKALDVLRYLNGQEGGATTDQIVEGTGLSERAFGKAIRRLVTRYYVEMPTQGFYTLTASGQDAGQTLRVYDGADLPPGTASSERAPAPTDKTTDEPDVVWHQRRLSVFLPKELVERSATRIRTGFDRPAPDANPQTHPARIILRINAPGCDIEPVERPVEIAVDAPAGPIDFRITPRRAGTVRVRIEAFQLVTLRELNPVGGMFFDLSIAGFPTPESAEFHTLAATLRLHPGKDT